MSDFKVIEHYPSINAEDINKDLTITVKFNKEIDADSINYRVGTLIDSQYNVIKCNYGVDSENGSITILTVKPKENLLGETTYTFTLFSKENSIKSKDGLILDDSYSFNFTTSIYNSGNNDDDLLNRLQDDLTLALNNEDYKTAAILKSLIDRANAGESLTQVDVDISLGLYETPTDAEIESGIPPIDITSYFPNGDNIRLSDLKYIKISMSDVISNNNLNSLINITSTNVLD